MENETISEVGKKLKGNDFLAEDMKIADFAELRISLGLSKKEAKKLG